MARSTPTEAPTSDASAPPAPAPYRRPTRPEQLAALRASALDRARPHVTVTVVVREDTPIDDVTYHAGTRLTLLADEADDLIASGAAERAP